MQTDSESQSAIQLTIIPPDVVEIVITLGAVLSTDHGQVQVEVRDPVDGNLIAMWSRPSVALDQLEAELSDAYSRARQELRKVIWPFG